MTGIHLKQRLNVAPPNQSLLEWATLRDGNILIFLVVCEQERLETTGASFTEDSTYII